MKLIVIALACLAVLLVLMERMRDKLPTPLRIAFDLWMKFAHALGTVMSTIILTALWIIVFGPYALLWKIAHSGNQPSPDDDTFWKDIPDDARTDMRYQF